MSLKPSLKRSKPPGPTAATIQRVVSFARTYALSARRPVKAIGREIPYARSLPAMTEQVSANDTIGPARKVGDRAAAQLCIVDPRRSVVEVLEETDHRQRWIFDRLDAVIEGLLIHLTAGRAGQRGEVFNDLSGKVIGCEVPVDDGSNRGLAETSNDRLDIDASAKLVGRHGASGRPLQPPTLGGLISVIRRCRRHTLHPSRCARVRLRAG